MGRIARNLVASVACVMALTAASAVTVGASETLQSPTTGQNGAPTNTCGAPPTGNSPVTPGNAVNAGGSPFNPAGQAGNVYAGNPGTASKLNANSTAVVSQYDTACFRLSSH